MKRVCLIVLDSVGIGELPDAADFGDAGSHTLGNINAARPLALPNLFRMGLGNIENSRLPKEASPTAAYGRCAEKTHAKDTTCGHWEMMGIIMEQPFKTFPDGFPREILDEFEKRIGRKTLGNEVASGTEIIQRLGGEHVRTGSPIVYTSADSVFQIAAHEEVIPIAELYKMWGVAREILTGDYSVGRVIARPFVGEKAGAYRRTERRRDFAVPPVEETVMDGIIKAQMTVLGVGKIEDIFCGVGLTRKNHTTNNADGISATADALKNGNDDFIFTNLVDTDMLYGHRNDVEGYAGALEYFDARLPEIVSALRGGDMLIITADHGCDPTTPSTDHSREYIPLLVYGAGIKAAGLGTRGTFADIGATVYEYLTGGTWKSGKSFLGEIAE